MDLHQLALKATRGNEQAALFLTTLVTVLHAWDDLIDRDKQLSDDDINQAFFAALVSLPTNPFYAQNFAYLNPVLQTAIANWITATRMERGEFVTEYELRIAYVLRSSYVDVVVQTAALCGGAGWAHEITREVREFAHGETYEGYLANLDIERSARVAHDNALAAAPPLTFIRPDLGEGENHVL